MMDDIPRFPQAPPEDQDRTTREELRRIKRVESREVRLIVSIPALLFLMTLTGSIVSHIYFLRISEHFPSAEAREFFEQQATVVLLIGGTFSIISGIVGVALAWTIVHPLRDMIRTMTRAAQGELAPIRNVPRTGELFALGSTFNRMIHQLQDLFEERDRQMRESAKGTILSLNSTGAVMAADSSLRRVLGLASADLLGKPLVEMLEKQSSSRLNNVFLRELAKCITAALDGRTATCSSEFWRGKEDEPVLLSISAMPLECSSPSDPVCLLDVRDLSGMRSFHEQMQRADRLAAVGTLATGIAHEIRNPLASIRGMAQLMALDIPKAEPGEEDKTPPPGSPSADYLDRIQKEVDRLEKLVASIMDFAHPEGVDLHPVDLNRLLREAFEAAFHRVAIPHHIELDIDWDLDEDLPECVVEESRLHQALLNLAVNALEAIRDHGGVIRLCSRVAKSGTRPVCLSISNTGWPIPRETRERLFEPFFTTKPEGTGLGLPIAYQIVVANNGLLELSCEEGMVTFQIRFPIQGRLATGLVGRPSFDPPPSGLARASTGGIARPAPGDPPAN